MKHTLYTFLGCTTALQYIAQHSSAADRNSILAACDTLTNVGQEILGKQGANASDEEFKELFGTQVTSVLEAIETLKQSSIIAEIHPNLLTLLEYYYAAADGLMGGGGWPDSGWPTSLSEPEP